MSSVAIPANVRFLADLCCLNVRTTSNKDGAHSASELYKMLLEVRAWLDAPDPDHAAKWYKRRKAEEHTNILTESTTESMAQPDPKTWTSVFSIFGYGAQKPNQGPTVLRDVGAIIAKDVCKAVPDPKDAAHLLWMLAVSGVGAPVTAVRNLPTQPDSKTDSRCSQIAEVLEYYLSDLGSHHWPKIIEVAKGDSPKANAELEKYFLEAHRLTSAQLVKHVSGDRELLLDIGAANRDPSTFAKPNEFSLKRPVGDYIIHGYGPRGQIGRDMLLAYGTAMLKVAARVQGLRPAPGQMGELKKVYVKNGGKGQQQGRRHYLTADWAYVVDEPTRTTPDSFSIIGPPLQAVHASIDRALTGFAVDPSLNIYLTYPRNSGPTPNNVVIATNFTGEKPWPTPEIQNCTAGQNASTCFINVQNVVLDPQDPEHVMWVVDSGIPPVSKSATPYGAKVMAFNLSNSTLIRTYPISPDLYHDGMNANDVRINNTLGPAGFAFITDESEHGSLLAIDLATGTTTRHLFNTSVVKADPGYVGSYDGQPIYSWNGTRKTFTATGADGIALQSGNLYWGVLASRRFYHIPQTRLIDPSATDPDLLATAVVFPGELGSPSRRASRPMIEEMCI
ncbi:MAG: hypothetical protein L6R40_004448 [Gallowayella cf. fulva]|nr:MAG: hypothetical protein L6R40_004448 [Xanthomendoza cf. fulva]